MTIACEALDTDPEDNMLTSGTISDMEIAERKLLEMDDWSTHCAKVRGTGRVRANPNPDPDPDPNPTPNPHPHPHPDPDHTLTLT